MVPKTIGGVFINRTHFETVRTDKVRVVLLKEVFFAISKQTGCPDKATQKYFNLLVKGIQHEGAGYLKILAAQPIMGLRVLGNDVPKRSDFGLKVRSRTGFPILFAWYYQSLYGLREAEPTRANVLKIRRILTVLSIGKMLTYASAKRIKRERSLYAERSVKRLDPERLRRLRELYAEEIQEFLKFVNFKGRDDKRLREEHGLDPPSGRVTLDPGCYSLKCFAKRSNRRLLNEVPEAVSVHLLNRSVLSVTQGFTYNATALARRTIPDGKQSVLVEQGGKFRGITSYYSPLIHSASVYSTMRSILSSFDPDCSLDQSKGHRRVQKLTTQRGQRLPIVSADASAFTDSLDLDLCNVLLECIGEAGYLEYLADISIATDNGIISTSLPLMGIKGCFELGCVMLAWGLWREHNKRYGLRRRRNLILRGSAHCCDDFAARATIEAVQAAYASIGTELNYKKTIVSYTSAIFCGEMYWKGAQVTPTRLNLTTLFTERSGTVLLPYVRDFLDRAKPVWGKHAMRCVKPYIRSACIKAVGAHNVNFFLPTKLGGVPVLTKHGYGLLEILEKRTNLLYALYNTPIESLEPDTLSRMVGYIRLGNPVKQPDGTILPSVNLPGIGKSGWAKRKKLVVELHQSGSLSVQDVLEFYYSTKGPLILA